MILYEFLNPSDKITFYAENDDVARAVTLILGEGKAGCRNTKNNEHLPNCMTAFGTPAPKEVYEQLEQWLNKKHKPLAEALNTVAVCSEYEREIYDEYTENSKNTEKWAKWDNKHRSSLNDFGYYARKLANHLLNM